MNVNFDRNDNVDFMAVEIGTWISTSVTWRPQFVRSCSRCSAFLATFWEADGTLCHVRMKISWKKPGRPMRFASKNEIVCLSLAKNSFHIGRKIFLKWLAASFQRRCAILCLHETRQIAEVRDVEACRPTYWNGYCLSELQPYQINTFSIYLFQNIKI